MSKSWSELSTPIGGAMQGTIVLLGVCCRLLFALSAGSPGRGQTQSAFPEAVAALTARLAFHVSAPASQGPLEQQVTTALHDVINHGQGGRVVKLRVFVAADGDVIPVEATLRDVLAAMRVPLPALAVVRVAGVADADHGVVIESVAEGSRTVNPNGLAFLAGAATPTGDATIGALLEVARATGLAPANLLRVSCFLESRNQLAVTRKAVTDSLPAVDVSYVVSRIAPDQPLVECEAVARRTSPPTAAVTYFNLPGSQPSPNYSHATLVSTSRLVFTQAVAALGSGEPELRGAFDRARRAVEQFDGHLDNVVMANNYFVDIAARQSLRTVRPAYFGPTHVPAATGIVVSGVGEAKAAAAIELAVAAQ